ncbi:DNA-3-methyladenine glycosylase [Psychrobacter sp. ANT_H3]|uniref:DNA-3-methyladenine glycosylase n=1 Tax=Psychrobacter sp. ANT_H3 TaxID=3019444 RepID=UPI0022F1A126|nr:DNA-3-methyladenine glycosylase [Psychrobacter sp. ANT_H3]MDA5133093.1 DNA-3-methyladenine glycosylase [Psychrobacter sp. ANT_H3]
MLAPKPSDTQTIILEPAWFSRPTCVVAADLIGKVLCRQLTDSDGKQRILRMRISETEAYIGEGDAACHAHAGTRTARTEIMYSQGGVFYVYLTYGIHHMLNLVSGPAESPEAVLIRAGFFTEDSERLLDEQLLSVDKPLSPLKEIKQLAGPGKLTKHLQIDRDLYGEPITPASEVWIEDDGCQPPISLRPRIGIDYAGEAKDWLLRYIWTDHPSLSKK